MARIPGEHKNTDKSKDHARGFSLALEDALKKWNRGDGDNMVVTFQVDVTPNPGGVGTYRIVLSPQ